MPRVIEQFPERPPSQHRERPVRPEPSPEEMSPAAVPRVHTSGRRRTALQREAQRAEIGRLDRQGLRQWEIAARLGIAQSTVSEEIRLMRQQYRDQEHRFIGERIGELLAHYADVRRQAWAAWERSQRVGTRRTITTTERGIRTTVTRESRLPDSEYMHLVLSTLEAERKLLGLDAVDASAHLSVEQVVALMNAVLQAAALEVNDPEVMDRLQRRALDLMPAVGVVTAAAGPAAAVESPAAAGPPPGDDHGGGSEAAGPPADGGRDDGRDEGDRGDGEPAVFEDA